MGKNGPREGKRPFMMSITASKFGNIACERPIGPAWLLTNRKKAGVGGVGGIKHFRNLLMANLWFWQEKRKGRVVGGMMYCHH